MAIIIANGILASVGWYGIYSDGDILSWVIALPLTLFMILEIKGFIKDS